MTAPNLAFLIPAILKKIITLCILLSGFTQARLLSQPLRYSISMPFLSLGAYSNLQQDVFSLAGNQASLAGINGTSAGIYSEQRFIKENRFYAVAASLPTALGNFGMILNYAGFKNFNEHKLGIAYGRKLSGKISIGVQFNYYGYRAPSYAPASALNFEAGAIIRLAANLNCGIHVYNPVAGRLGKSGNRKLAAAYKFGAGFDASENVFISAEAIKEEGRTVNVNAGILYRYKDRFFARIGLTGEISGGYAGAGVYFRSLRIDIAVNYHPQLGFSPGVMLTANLKRSRK